jgi:phosphatidylinositol alpha-mannosyltransferase
MKIGLVCPYNIAKGGGVQEIVRDLRKGLMARGHDVKIITPQPREPEGCDMEGVICLGTAADFRSPLHTTPQFSVSVDTAEIDEMLEREQFDVLHFHEPWVPMLSKQILSRSKATNVATFHAKVPETLMSRTVAKVVTPYTRSVLKYLQALTAVSDAAAEYVSGLTDEPVTIIPNGIDLKRFHAPKTQKEHDEKTILYVGRLERRKGVKHLFEAYQKLAEEHERVRLVIAGDGPDREKLEILAEDMHLPDVTFLGYVSEEVKLQLLAEADLFCSPALYGESFGIVLLEAMATGLVVVAGDNPGYESVMRDMGALSLVNPRDTAAFERKLDLLLHEKSLRVEWRKWALGYVKQFDYPNITSEYEDLYEYAMAHHTHKVKLNKP